MKNKIILILLLSSSLCINAQSEDNQFYIGVNSGYTYSRVNLYTELEDWLLLETDQDFISAFGGGIVFKYYSEPRFAIQIEANYSQRGWKESTFTAFYTRNTKYLEFPILSHFDIPLKGMNISLALGPAFSYFLSESENYTLFDESAVEPYYDTPIDNKFETGLCVGLGLNKFFGRNIIQVEARLNLGLSNLFSEEHGFEFDHSQNQVLGIKASYLFGW